MVYAPTPLGKGSTRAWGLMPSSSVGFVSFEKPTNRVYSLSSGAIFDLIREAGSRIAQSLVAQRFEVSNFILWQALKNGINRISLSIYQNETSINGVNGVVA
jgi:hypothetical protein